MVNIEEFVVEDFLNASSVNRYPSCFCLLLEYLIRSRFSAEFLKKFRANLNGIDLYLKLSGLYSNIDNITRTELLKDYLSDAVTNGIKMSEFDNRTAIMEFYFPYISLFMPYIVLFTLTNEQKDKILSKANLTGESVEEVAKFQKMDYIEITEYMNKLSEQGIIHLKNESDAINKSTTTVLVTEEVNFAKDYSRFVCFTCRKKGHISRFCKFNKNKKQWKNYGEVNYFECPDGALIYYAFKDEEVNVAESNVSGVNPVKEIKHVHFDPEEKNIKSHTKNEDYTPIPGGPTLKEIEEWDRYEKEWFARGDALCQTEEVGLAEGENQSNGEEAFVTPDNEVDPAEKEMYVFYDTDDLYEAARANKKSREEEVHFVTVDSISDADENDVMHSFVTPDYKPDAAEEEMFSFYNTDDLNDITEKYNNSLYNEINSAVVESKTELDNCNKVVKEAEEYPVFIEASRKAEECLEEKRLDLYESKLLEEVYVAETKPEPTTTDKSKITKEYSVTAIKSENIDDRIAILDEKTVTTYLDMNTPTYSCMIDYYKSYMEHSYGIVLQEDSTGFNMSKVAGNDIDIYAATIMLIKKFQSLLSRTNKKLGVIRINRSLVNYAIVQYCKLNNILLCKESNLSSLITSLQVKIDSSLKYSQVNKSYWNFCFNYIIYQMNNTSMNNQWTPYELITSKRSYHQILPSFGCQMSSNIGNGKFMGYYGSTRTAFMLNDHQSIIKCVTFKFDNSNQITGHKSNSFTSKPDNHIMPDSIVSTYPVYQHNNATSVFNSNHSVKFEPLLLPIYLFKLFIMCLMNKMIITPMNMNDLTPTLD